MSRILTLDLLRHGETEGGAIYRGRTDSQLTETGRQQMLDKLSSHIDRWQVVYSSPLSRCSEIARQFCQQSSVPLQLDERLQELDFGLWEGMTLEQVWQEYPKQSESFWQNPEKCPPPEGESISDLRERLNQLLDELCACGAEPLLLITHGGVIRALIAEVLGIAPENWSRLSISHGSLSRIRIGVNADNKQEWALIEFINR